MSGQAMHTEFSSEDIKALEPTMKVGLLATVNPEGLPHLTLISSLKANTPHQLTWGQFTEGLSKQFIRDNPKVGWLVMTLDRQVWRGKATFSHTLRQGPEYDWYNNTPMFRYNAYFGIHTVYFMELVEQTGRQALPMGSVVLAAVQTMVARTLSPGARRGPEVINGWTRELMNKLDNLKYLAYVGADGYPVVIPAIQAQAAGGDGILFAASAFRADLEAMVAGAPLAVFGMSLDMETVLLRGTYRGIGRRAGVRCGSVAVDWAYNPMPPTPRQIYPPLPLEPVTAF